MGDGQVFLNDEDITNFPMHNRANRGVSYLPQEPSVFRKLTVEENLLAVLESQKLSTFDRKKKARSLLRELNILHIKDCMAYSLSGGERRRVEISRAIATSTIFVLLDEPFAGIDEIDRPGLSGDVKALIKESGAASLLVTHDISEAVLLAKRLVVLSDGKVIQEGDVGDVIAKPISSKIAKLLGLSVFDAEEFTRLFQIDRPMGNFTEVAVPMNGIKAVPSIEGLGKIMRLEVSVKGLVAVIAVSYTHLTLPTNREV